MKYYIKLLKILSMFEEYKSELVVGVTGVVAGVLTSFFARRKNNAEADNTLADGVAKIVETSNRLLEMTSKSLQEEKEHHFNCTKRVEAVELHVQELTKKIGENNYRHFAARR
jgi:hypothetical protein